MDKKRTMQRRNNNNKVTYRVFVLISWKTFIKKRRLLVILMFVH